MNLPYKITVYTAGASVVAMGLSVSLSQILMTLTVILFLFTHRDSENSFAFLIRSGWFFWGAGLFLWLGILAVVQSAVLLHHSDLSGAQKVLLRSEFSKAVLFLFGVVIFFLTVSPGHSSRILAESFLILAGILIFSGVISSFTEYRLSHLVSYYFFNIEKDHRPLHPFTDLFFIRLHRPIGFMNTRLTFGGMLSLILPFVLWYSAAKASDIRKSVPLFFLFGSGILILLMNGARSAQAGFTAGMLWLALLIIYFYFKTRTFSVSFRLLSVLSLAALFSAASAVFFLYIEDGFSLLRNTDHQRSIVWLLSREIIAENPLTGTGPGLFEITAEFKKFSFIRNQPEIWYWISNTPVQHSHNDLLHFTAAAGLPAGFLFLLFAAFTAAGFSRPSADLSLNKNSLFKILIQSPWLFIGAGLISFFVAGLAQCYFQDDEAVQLFWSLSGFALGLQKANQDRQQFLY